MSLALPARAAGWRRARRADAQRAAVRGGRAALRGPARGGAGRRPAGREGRGEAEREQSDEEGDGHHGGPVAEAADALGDGDEGEPGTFKDRFYLERTPHLFLEGMLIAAWAIEAEKAYIYMRDEYPAVLEILETDLLG